MKKAVIILLLFSVFNIKVTGADTVSRQLPRVTFGAEWGYVATFFSYHSYNYFSTEGYRMSEKHGAFGIGSNGEVNLHIGYNLNHHWNIALYAGFTGLMNIHMQFLSPYVQQDTSATSRKQTDGWHSST